MRRLLPWATWIPIASVAIAAAIGWGLYLTMGGVALYDAYLMNSKSVERIARFSAWTPIDPPRREPQGMATAWREGACSWGVFDATFLQHRIQGSPEPWLADRGTVIQVSPRRLRIGIAVTVIAVGAFAAAWRIAIRRMIGTAGFTGTLPTH